MTLSLSHQGNRSRKIAIVYDTSVRPDTTGEHCRRALEKLGAIVSHYLPGEAEAIPPVYDLYLRVDDDLEYGLPAALHPLAYWAIDTHRDYARRLERARAADFVFCAQRNGTARMQGDGIASARWLPLACDPEIHRRIPGLPKQHDLCFVGNTFPGDGERSRLVEWIRVNYRRSFVGRAYGEEMARIYSASRLVFNCAIRDDVNMRVFEAAACGSLLLTNDLASNGQDLLFTPGVHLVTYRTAEELPGLIGRYLGEEEERERIAEAGMRHAHAQHSYRHRMTDVLAAVFDGVDLDERYPVEKHVPSPPPSPAPGEREGEGEMAGCQLSVVGLPFRSPLVSIIIPTFNHLALTQACVESIRAYTDLAYEIIIVDNGSRDGTADWAQAAGLRVIANPKNLGFPRACNQGMLAATGEYLLLLNNDTLISPGWLRGLLAQAEADPRAGLVGPSTNFAGSCQQIPADYTSREEFLAFAARIAREHAGQAQQVHRLVGLCLLIPRRVMQEVGLLDERYGIGLFEDDDYCLRVRMAGYRLLWAREVFIHHEGHQTFRALAEEEQYRRHLRENERLFREKWDVARHLQPWVEETRLVGRLQGGAAGPWDLLRAGRYAEAYDAFEALLRAGPPEVPALLGLGLAAEGRGAAAAAALAYRSVLRLAPDQPEAVRGLARARALPAPAPAPRRGNGTSASVKTSIVIVTFNSLADLPDCLHSIRSTTQHPYEILLVDNASTDGTRDYLDSIPDARVILNSTNQGFSRACNQGIREARGEQILLLNPDTVLTAHWDAKLMAHFGEGVGAVGPVSDYVVGLQKFQPYLREPLTGPVDLAGLAARLEEWNRGRSVETKLLIGFCLMLKRGVIDRVGMLDEELFLGNDDLEYSLRLRRHGLRLLVATDTFVHHKGQASFRAQPPEAVASRLRESAWRLHRKLVQWYGEGKVPSSTELWGVEVFGLLPDGSLRADDPLIGCAA